MSELITTQEEKDAASYLDWDDAALGRFTKHVALVLQKITDDSQGLKRVTSAAAAMLIFSSLVESNAAFAEFIVNDYSRKGVTHGDWSIVVRKLDEDGNPVELSDDPNDTFKYHLDDDNPGLYNLDPDYHPGE